MSIVKPVSRISPLGRRLRIGIVGGGQGSVIGASHIYGIRLDARFDVVAACADIDPVRGRVFAEGLGVSADRSYATHAQMIEVEAARADGIDAVAILTPNHTHYEIASDFADAGIHILCEKPLAIDIAHARALAAKAEAAGIVLTVMYGYSGYPMVRQMRAMVRDGAIGRVRLIESEFAFGNPVTMAEAPGGHWRTTRAVSGPAAVVGMLGTHALHLGEFVTGETLAEVAADFATFVEGRELEDNAHMMLRYTSGVRGSMWLSYVAAGQEHGLRLRVFGTEGGLEWHQERPDEIGHMVPGGARRAVRRGQVGLDGETWAATHLALGFPESFAHAFANIYADFADRIEVALGAPDDGAGHLLPSAGDGVAGVRFVDACVESAAANGAWVPMVR